MCLRKFAGIVERFLVDKKYTLKDVTESGEFLLPLSKETVINRKLFVTFMSYYYC
jgi:hypothetical protein